MRVKIMKLLGIAYIQLDDEIEVIVNYTDDHELGEIGRIAHIARDLYQYDDPTYIKRKKK